MLNPAWLQVSRARQRFYAAVRSFLVGRGFDEVETPSLVPAPGMDPHITAFEVPFFPEMDQVADRLLYLRTSPEYALKRLLASGAGPIFEISKAFRNGEVSQTHNPEFSMLELYRPHAGYEVIMADLEALLADADRALGSDGFFGRVPFERLTLREAVLRESGVDLHDCADGEALASAAERAGVRVGESRGFEQVLCHLLVQKVEPSLGRERPTFLTEFPASMALMARLKPGDPRVAERFELYARSDELGNGYSELTDPVEQRRRLEAEQERRRVQSRPVYPIDEVLIEAVGRMPPCTGVGVGLDRILMQLIGAKRIDEVLLFPVRGFPA